MRMDTVCVIRRDVGRVRRSYKVTKTSTRKYGQWRVLEPDRETAHRHWPSAPP